MTEQTKPTQSNPQIIVVFDFVSRMGTLEFTADNKTLKYDDVDWADKLWAVVARASIPFGVSVLWITISEGKTTKVYYTLECTTYESLHGDKKTDQVHFLV